MTIGLTIGFFTTLDDLMAQGLMQTDEPPLDCFYSITEKGIALIEGDIAQ